MGRHRDNQRKILNKQNASNARDKLAETGDKIKNLASENSTLSLTAIFILLYVFTVALFRKHRKDHQKSQKFLKAVVKAEEKGLRLGMDGGELSSLKEYVIAGEQRDPNFLDHLLGPIRDRVRRGRR